MRTQDVTNPHREGTKYHVAFNFMLKQWNPPGSPRFTKSELVDAIINKYGGTEKEAEHAANVVLSPREEAPVEEQHKAPEGVILSKDLKTDCRGNMSSAGWMYYVTRHPGKVVQDEKGNEIEGEHRYQLRIREKALPKRQRGKSSGEKQEVKAKTKESKRASEKEAEKSPEAEKETA